MLRRRLAPLLIFLCAWLLQPSLASEAPPDRAPTQRKDGAWYLYLSDAQAEARRSGRPMLLFFTGSDWCKECRKLPEERMRESDALHERYKLFHVASKPCILLVTPEGAVIAAQRLKADRSSPAAWIRDAEAHLAKAKSD